MNDYAQSMYHHQSILSQSCTKIAWFAHIKDKTLTDRKLLERNCESGIVVFVREPIRL